MTAYLPLAFDHSRYVPLVLTRQGELAALELLDSRVKDEMTPVLLAHPVPADASGMPHTTVQGHVEELLQRVAKGWGPRPAFIDLGHLDVDGLVMPDGTPPLQWLVRECAELGLPLAPVTSPTRTAEQRGSAVAAAQDFSSALCLRMDRADWIDLGRPAGDGRLMLLLAETGLPASRVHLLLDCGDQVGDPAVTARALEPVLAGLPLAQEWASLTVAGTGMPVGTSEIGADSTGLLPRTEWALWRLLDGHGYRRPSFGDYVVQHPDPQSGFDPRLMDTSAQLRYTVSEHWFVARGRGLKKNGHEQVRGLARQLVSLPAYSGADFSWGDRWLHLCADGQGKPGSQLIWRKATTTHHLTYVVSQLSTLLGT